jgi:hypothetical protein
MSDIYDIPCNGDNGEGPDYEQIAKNQKWDVDFLNRSIETLIITTREIPLNVNYENKDVFIEAELEDKLILQNLSKLGAKNIYVFKNITPTETYDALLENIRRVQKRFKDLNLLDSQEYLDFQDELNKLSIDIDRKG